MADITIYTGHFGSGKTEIAINEAIEKKGIIIDLDTVNPYFRSSDLKDFFEKNNVRLISPHFANTNVDIPSLKSEVFAVFSSDKPVIFDVGGDGEGATALGQYKNYFDKSGYKMILVVNVYRPMTKTVEEILEMIYEIEKNSRLKVSGVINNSNLGTETKPENVEYGEKIVREAAEKAGIPFLGNTSVIFYSGARQIKLYTNKI